LPSQLLIGDVGLVVGAKIGTTGHPGHVGIAGVQGQEAVVASQRSLMMPGFFWGFGGIVDDSRRCLCHMLVGRNMELPTTSWQMFEDVPRNFERKPTVIIQSPD